MRWKIMDIGEAIGFLRAQIQTEPEVAPKQAQLSNGLPPWGAVVFRKTSVWLDVPVQPKA